MTALPCRALLIDCDGVLVDSDESVRLSWSRWARERGLDPDGVLAQVHGRRSRDTVALLVPAEECPNALTAIDRYEVEDAHAVVALPGASALLNALPAHIWAVVTSGTRALVQARMAAAGLPQPAVLVTADDVDDGKPHPAGYLEAARRLGVPAQECVVLEDSAAGVAAGAAAGAAVVGVGQRALGTPAALAVRDLTGLQHDGVALRIPDDVLLRGDLR